MAGGESGGHTRELDHTPTWAVASVCAVIILISILLEKGLHHLGEFSIPVKFAFDIIFVDSGSQRGTGRPCSKLLRRLKLVRT
ncbi:hypothetical protein BHE74_00011542 [Ensete ventricosum]|uniref:Uncharacterized protein n=1 Tax=Ensete ventricosum TaxID=4639 RepID=A0A444FF68_ENSVE|nr:hypothetical protein B296_00011669 [Ensete ventricosum]RWW21270.1 hypothetical protein GW17_00014584 [Ensete ventricosum]RWW80133.1 hypothetical protein BHE74_00011542 [Ensete ventricosum]RZR82363.1 hypothetical protein BHM03_00008762 [Ensete ventricosum]